MISIGVEKSLVVVFGESANGSILFSGLKVLYNPPDPRWQHYEPEEKRGGSCCNSLFLDPFEGQEPESGLYYKHKKGSLKILYKFFTKIYD